MNVPPERQYADVLRQRTVALEGLFGKHSMYLASPVPFYLGGDATIIGFDDYLPGHSVYCTNEMTGAWGSGQKPSTSGEFELVMVLPKGSPLAPVRAADGLVRKGWLGVTLDGFAKYSTQAVLTAGEVAGPLPDAFSPHTHLLFVDLNAGKVKFGFGGRQYGLLLLLSISAAEQRFQEERGAEALLKKLRQAGAYPASSPARKDVV